MVVNNYTKIINDLNNHLSHEEIEQKSPQVLGWEGHKSVAMLTRLMGF